MSQPHARPTHTHSVLSSILSGEAASVHQLWNKQDQRLEEKKTHVGKSSSFAGLIHQISSQPLVRHCLGGEEITKEERI